MKICQFSVKKICRLNGRAIIPSSAWLRSLLDEAAAIMLGQLSTAHGLAARVERQKPYQPPMSFGF
jgi:hypothetical protein